MRAQINATEASTIEGEREIEPVNSGKKRKESFRTEEPRRKKSKKAAKLKIVKKVAKHRPVKEPPPKKSEEHVDTEEFMESSSNGEFSECEEEEEETVSLQKISSETEREDNSEEENESPDEECKTVGSGRETTKYLKNNNEEKRKHSGLKSTQQSKMPKAKEQKVNIFPDNSPTKDSIDDVRGIIERTQSTLLKEIQEMKTEIQKITHECREIRMSQLSQSQMSYQLANPYQHDSVFKPDLAHRWYTNTIPIQPNYIASTFPQRAAPPTSQMTYYVSQSPRSEVQNKETPNIRAHTEELCLFRDE